MNSIRHVIATSLFFGSLASGLLFLSFYVVNIAIIYWLQVVGFKVASVIGEIYPSADSYSGFIALLLNAVVYAAAISLFRILFRSKATARA
jgi:hypothetical protein